jgi:hypothetical protein
MSNAPMALTVMTNPNFGVIDIDPQAVASVLDAFVKRGSKLTGVALDDINRGVMNLPADNTAPNLEFLLKNGMKLFDAIVWLTAGAPASHPLVLDASITEKAIPSLHEVARCVFYCYFFILTQARYPASRNETNKPKVANFLKVVMGMDAEQNQYIETICSFTPQKFDPLWARNVSFVGLGQEVLSRFGLGVAGYRLFGPFKLYQPKAGISAELMNAFNFARNVAMAPPSWAIHPTTRDPTVLTKRGNLNKNLGNLILRVFTKEQIDEMVTVKILYKYPEEEPTHKNFLAWKAEDDISGNQHIFQANRV